MVRSETLLFYFFYFHRWPRIVFIFQYKFFMASTIPLFYQLAHRRHFSSSSRRSSQIESLLRGDQRTQSAWKKKKHIPLANICTAHGITSPSPILLFACHMAYNVHVCLRNPFRCCVVLCNEPREKVWKRGPQNWQCDEVKSISF